MLQVSAIITNQRQADAWAAFQQAYLGEPKAPDLKAAAKAVADIKREFPHVAQTPPPPAPLETAIEAKQVEQDADDQPAEASPLDALASPQPETTAEVLPETKKRTKKAKVEPAPETAEQSEDKPLTLADIRKASQTTLELIGAPVIQEALAKLNAVDQKDQALRMSALPEKDYARYVEFLKKKVNDAAKEWPVNG